MIASVDLQRATWNELPWKFEAGTPMIAEAVGLGAAVDYLDGARDGARARARAGADRLHARASGRRSPACGWSGRPRPARRGGLASFTIEGMHPHDVAELAGRAGVCIRAGHHCAQPLMRCLGVGATARASVGRLQRPPRHRRARSRRCIGAAAKIFEDCRWTTSTATTSSTTTSARGTSASSIPTTWRRSSTTRSAATSSACTSACRTDASRTCASTATAARSPRPSASIASEELKGMELEEVGELGADWMIELLGIPVSATRRKCALLNLKVDARRRHRRRQLAHRGGGAAEPASASIQFLVAAAQDSLRRTCSEEPAWPHWLRHRTKITKPSPIVEDEQGQLRAAPGHLARGRAGAVEDQGRARLDGREAAEVAGDLRTQADPDVGPGPRRAEPRRPRALLAADGRALQQLGRRARRR